MVGLGGLMVSVFDLQAEGHRLESLSSRENFQTILYASTLLIIDIPWIECAWVMQENNVANFENMPIQIY